MKKTITIFSPATIANVGPGFDIMGFAIDQPGDKISLEKIRERSHRILNKTSFDLPLDPDKNAATVALSGFLNHIGSKDKFLVTFLEKIQPGSGIGSSAASSAGSVFAANLLMNNPLSRKELVQFAMLGEQAASGTAHADNVAPALMGGFVLIRSYHPLDLIDIPFPSGLFCTVIHPEIQLATKESRRILKGNVPLNIAVTQAGNVAGLITGLLRSDFSLIRNSLHDVIAEPVRSFLIPGFEKLKEASITAGALGTSISGSGPSVFSLCDSRKSARAVAGSFKKIFDDMDIPNKVFVSGINHEGVHIIESH
jgi:homoserine kinase